MISKKLANLINNWIYYQNKSAEIVNYLFNHTELFEQKYTYDFKDSLFRYFAGKIGRNATDINKLMKTLTEEDKKVLTETELERRF